MQQKQPIVILGDKQKIPEFPLDAQLNSELESCNIVSIFGSIFGNVVFFLTDTGQVFSCGDFPFTPKKLSRLPTFDNLSIQFIAAGRVSAMFVSRTTHQIYGLGK